MWVKNLAERICCVCLELAGLPDPFLLLVGCTSTHPPDLPTNLVVWLYIQMVVPQPTLLPTYNIQMVVCLYLLDWLSISLVQICIVQHFLRFFKQVLSIDLIEKSLGFSMRKVN